MLQSINFDDSQLLEEIRKLKPETDTVYQVADDLAVSALFSEIFKNVLCYCSTIEKWLIYNGRIMCPAVYYETKTTLQEEIC